MNIELTPQQQQALDTQEGGPPRITDPRTHTTYVLVPEVDYETIRELLLNDESRARMGTAARTRVEQEFSYARFSGRILKILNEFGDHSHLSY